MTPAISLLDSQNRTENVSWLLYGCSRALEVRVTVGRAVSAVL